MGHNAEQRSGWNPMGMSTPNQGGMSMGVERPVQGIVVTALVWQMFMWMWMFMSGVALMKIGRAMWLRSQVKAYKAIRDEVSDDQRRMMVDDLWKHVGKSKMMWSLGKMQHEGGHMMGNLMHRGQHGQHGQQGGQHGQQYSQQQGQQGNWVSGQYAGSSGPVSELQQSRESEWQRPSMGEQSDQAERKVNLGM
jgi:hypothetical protein